jgi:methylenetetrahydrofolate reductase (NADPH)
VVGLPGLATAKTLLRYAVECGVGASLQTFAKRYSEITKLLRVPAPDESLVALARYREQTPHSRIARVHFYTFGSLERTVRWANQLLAGNVELTGEGALVLAGEPPSNPVIEPKEGVGRGLQES